MWMLYVGCEFGMKLNGVKKVTRVGLPFVPLNLNITRTHFYEKL